MTNVNIHSNHMKRKDFDLMPPREKILWLLSSKEDFGGPQSVSDMCKNLGVPNANVRSIVVRLLKAGKIQRVKKGTYRLDGDDRTYDPKKPLCDIN